VRSFTSITPEIITVTPNDTGAAKSGHLGFFLPEHRDTLWRGLRNDRSGVAVSRHPEVRALASLEGRRPVCGRFILRGPPSGASAPQGSRLRMTEI